MPAAVVDAQGQSVYLNRAASSNPVLAHLQVGRGDLDLAGDAAVRRLARQRRAYCEQAVQTRMPVYVEAAARDEDHRLLWLYAPVLDADDRVAEVIIMGFDVTRVHRQAVETSLHALIERIAREIQVPLTALVGLTHSLARELTWPQAERAAQIDQYGQLLLRQLRALLVSTPLNSET